MCLQSIALVQKNSDKAVAVAIAIAEVAKHLRSYLCTIEALALYRYQSMLSL